MHIIRHRGFTLLELLTTIAIVGILAIAANKFYQHYIQRAAGTELVELYDALREQTISAAGEKGIELCGDPPTSLISNIPGSPHAQLSIEKVDLGYAKPIGLHIKADVPTEGNHSVGVARGAYDTFNKLQVVAPGAIDNDSVVSFTAMLINHPCAVVASTSTATVQKPDIPRPTPGKADPAVPFDPQTAIPPLDVKPVVDASAGCPAGQEVTTVMDLGQAKLACATALPVW